MTLRDSNIRPRHFYLWFVDRLARCSFIRLGTIVLRTTIYIYPLRLVSVTLSFNPSTPYSTFLCIYVPHISDSSRPKITPLTLIVLPVHIYPDKSDILPVQHFPPSISKYTSNRINAHILMQWGLSLDLNKEDIYDFPRE